MDFLIENDRFTYLKPNYVFMLVLILLYADPNLDISVKPSLVDIMKFFKEPYEDEDHFKNLCAIITPYLEDNIKTSFARTLKNYALPFFFEILADVDYIDACLNYFSSFVLKKDGDNNNNNHNNNKHFLDSENKQTHVLFENSTFGSFVICCGNIIKNNLFVQEEVNNTTLTMLSDIFQFSLNDSGVWEGYKTSSNVYEFITKNYGLGDFGKSFFQFNVNNFLLEEMIPSESDKIVMLKLIKATDIGDNLPKKKNDLRALQKLESSRQLQLTQDLLFKELDFCENQYQMIMIILAMVDTNLRFNNLEAVVENLTILIENSRANKNKFILMLAYVIFYILLAQYPNMKKVKTMKPFILEQLDDLVDDSDMILSSLGEKLTEKFLCGKSLHMLSGGDFSKTFDVFKEINLLKLQSHNSISDNKNEFFNDDNEIFLLDYDNTLNSLYYYVNYWHLRLQTEQINSPNGGNYAPLTVDSVFRWILNPEIEISFKCHEFILKMFSKVMVDLKPLNSEEHANLVNTRNVLCPSRDEIYMIHYILITHMLRISCIESAFEHIHAIQQELGTDNFAWKFEFDLLKCVIYSKYNNNKYQVLNLYNDIFFGNDDGYYYKLDRYRKLLVQINYLCFKIHSNLEPDLTFTQLYEDLKYEIARFHGTRLYSLWEDILLNQAR